LFSDRQAAAAENRAYGDPKNVRKTLSAYTIIRKPRIDGFPLMLVGYMRVSSESDRQITDLQRDALLAAGVDGRHLFEDHASGAKDDRLGLAQALAFVRPGDVLVVWKLDRLGRSLSHLLCIIMQSIFRPASRRKTLGEAVGGWSPRRWSKNGLD